MTHPTDDQLCDTASGVEAMAAMLRKKGLSQSGDALDDAAAMLRACKGGADKVDLCAWPSCKCTARGQCRGLGVATNTAPDERHGKGRDSMTLEDEAAAMLRQCKGGTVRVKPLVFTERETSWWASSPFGIYVVAICQTDHGKTWAFWTPDQDDFDPDCAEDFFYYEHEALAAAQADYERRSLATLEPGPDARADGWNAGVEAAIDALRAKARANAHRAEYLNAIHVLRALAEKGPDHE